jgi:LacI family transcriptional regulator
VRTKPVTMSDVARQLGLSRSAVSFALNNEAQVSDKTRAHLIAGAQETFWHHGKSLIIAGTTTPETPDERSIDLMLEHRVGGIMFATTTNRAITLPSVLDGIPIVLVHCFDPSGRHASVIPDEERGGFSATSLLLERGRRRIGMINLRADLPAAEGRKAGYLAALRAAGVEPEPEWIVEGGAESDAGYAAAVRLLSSQRLDGLFCANDRLAMGAYDAARDLGIGIPTDLSVVGFDNQEIIARYVRPALSTVALPFREMGRIGAEIMMQDPDDDPATVIVDCPVVTRNSV